MAPHAACCSARLARFRFYFWRTTPTAMSALELAVIVGVAGVVHSQRLRLFESVTNELLAK